MEENNKKYIGRTCTGSYDKVEEKKNEGFQGYKYGRYRPGVKKDNGTPLKKNGRKRGTKIKNEQEFALQVGMIMNYRTFGTKKVSNEDNIKDGVKANEPMNVLQACKEVGISYQSFLYHLKGFPKVKEQYEISKENRILYMQEMADGLIEGALQGRLKDLTQKERVDFSFRLQEKTNQRYNPKTVVEQTIEEIDPNRSSADIMNDIADIINPE